MIDTIQNTGRDVRRGESLLTKLNSFLPIIKEKGTRDCLLIETIKNNDSERIIKHRLFFSGSGQLCIFNKGCHKYGHVYEPSYSTTNLDLYVKNKKDIDVLQRWEKSWKKVINMLEKSGLWTDALADYKTGLSVGLSKLKEAYSFTMGKDDEAIKRIREIDSRLLNKDETYFNTSILWYMTSPARVKKMYFGKWVTADKLAEIKQAFEKKVKCYVHGRANYDVSFEYNPELNKAWYSEEFKGCGNGHYYLALNETHALFYEDD